MPVLKNVMKIGNIAKIIISSFLSLFVAEAIIIIFSSMPWIVNYLVGSVAFGIVYLVALIVLREESVFYLLHVAKLNKLFK